MNENAVADVGAVGSIRFATLHDGDAIDELMKASTRDIFSQFYDEMQTRACSILR